MRIAQGISIVNASKPISTAVPFSYLFDTYTNGYAGYSLRKLRTAYTGSCIRVRRSSDNTEQDIGFVNNVLDTASLLTFVGANNGFVTKWYNQSSTASLDLSQATAVNQPKIVTAGALETLNGKVALTFSSSSLSAANNVVFNLFHNGSFSTIFMSLSLNNNAQASTIFNTINSTGSAIGSGLFFNSPLNGFSDRLGNYVYNGSGSTVPVQNLQLNSLTKSVQNILSLYIKANDATAANRSEMQVNNGSLFKNNTNTAAISTNNSGANFALGTFGGASYLDGKFQEFTVFNADMRTDRSNINTQLNFFYATY